MTEQQDGAAPGHTEVDLGWAAAVSDVGHRHHRNEDAFAVAATDERAALVVCDGVSSSANPHRASAAAATAALDTLRQALDETELGDVGALLGEAMEAAHLAVVEVPDSEPGGYPAAPSTTIVAALVAPDRVVVASLGDSRAYLLKPASRAGRRLTVDDSLAEEAIAQGVPAETAYASPQAHVITGWLGGDHESNDANVTTEVLDTPGLLLVCSDGLWNYFEPPEQLAQMASQAGGSPIAVARALVDAALAAGGADNITVAVARVGG